MPAFAARERRRLLSHRALYTPPFAVRERRSKTPHFFYTAPFAFTARERRLPIPRALHSSHSAFYHSAARK
jgi:hypothetical protein